MDDRTIRHVVMTPGVPSPQREDVAQRYTIRVTLKEFADHQGVPVDLYSEEPLPEPVYADWIAADLDRDDLYLRSAVEDSFSEEETAALRAWGEQRGDCTFEIRPMTYVDHFCLGTGALPCSCWVRGDIDLNQLPGFPLARQVRGRYALDWAADGPYVRDPDQGRLQLIGDEDGNLVVKLPPFGESPFGNFVAEVLKKGARP
jgi:hypothetical protein